jgi:hypothetical protein
MTATTKQGYLYHLHRAGAKYSYDYGWELNDEFIGEHAKEAYYKLIELKEKNK